MRGTVREMTSNSRGRGLPGWLAMLLCWAAVTARVTAAPLPPEPLVGPLSTWADLKRDYAAVGDGRADDTAALQRALDDLGTPTSRWAALWLPAGTYRITRTLVRTGVAGPMIIGEHPDAVILRWDGPSVRRVDRPFNSPEWRAWDGRDESEMFWFNGRNLRLERITFDGAGKAGSGFAFKWHDNKDPQTTSSHRISLADVVFKDMAIGFDGGGKQCWLDSEVLLQRCRFVRCSEFGLGLHHFNSVDYWLWQCEFVDCNVGVSNEPKPHGGVFHVYDSLFKGSTEADATIFHAGFFALRNNASVGSKRFFHAKNNGANGASITLQGNTIVDPQSTDALVFETLGNINLMDNTVVSRAGTTSGPVVRAEVRVAAAPAGSVDAFKDQEFVPVNLTAIGNTFTVADPVAVRGKVLELDTRVVDRGALPLGPPRRWDVPPRDRAAVIEVATNTGAAIQAAVDAATAFARAHERVRSPIVHLPRGVYAVTNTITLPGTVELQVVGDGAYQWADGLRGTVLKWADETTPGPVLRLRGPSRVLLRDLGVAGVVPWRRKVAPTQQPGGNPTVPPCNLQASIAVEDADQEGGQVLLQECNLSAWGGVGVRVDGLDRTRVQALAHEGTGISSWNTNWPATRAGDPGLPYPALEVIGGATARAGKPVATVLVQGTDTGRWAVRNGGRLLVRDQWYECNWAPFHDFFDGRGQFTLESALEAPFTHPTLKGHGTCYALKDFTGQLALVNVGYDLQKENPLIGFDGACDEARVLMLGLGVAVPTQALRLEGAQTHGARVTVVNTRNAASGVDDLNVDPVFVRMMLEHTRSMRFEPRMASLAGVTDLRLYRVWTEYARVGLHLAGGPETGGGQ